jgi:hypothetical protein
VIPLRAVALGLVVLLAGLRAAPAQPAPEAPRPVLNLALYGWLQSLDGRVGAGPFTVPISSGFRDTIDAADTVAAMMGNAEYRQGRVSAFLDGAYTRLGFNDLSIGPLAARASTSVLVLHFGAAVEVASGGDGLWALDVFGGPRFTKVRNEIGLPSGPSASRTAAWLEPFVGVRVRGQFGANWHYTLMGDVGGFGMGSDFAWQAVATLGYRFPLFGSDAAVVAGYRALSQDYRASGFRYDMTVHGPLIGLSLRF